MLASSPDSPGGVARLRGRAWGQGYMHELNTMHSLHNKCYINVHGSVQKIQCNLHESIGIVVWYDGLDDILCLDD